jgi:hypothetical protein
MSTATLNPDDTARRTFVLEAAAGCAYTWTYWRLHMNVRYAPGDPAMPSLRWLDYTSGGFVYECPARALSAAQDWSESLRDEHPAAEVTVCVDRLATDRPGRLDDADVVQRYTLDELYAEVGP